MNALVKRGLNGVTRKLRASEDYLSKNLTKRGVGGFRAIAHPLTKGERMRVTSPALSE